MPHDKPSSARRIDPNELPLWLPDEALLRATFDLCRAHWFVIRRYALDHGARGVGVVERVTAAKLGPWPPPDLLVHEGQEYGVGKCRDFSRHATLQADLDRDPRAMLVVVLVRGMLGRDPGKVDIGEFVFSIDAGPSGHQLARGDAVTLTCATVYALQALVYLARQEGWRVPGGEMIRVTGAPGRYLRNLLGALVGAGVLASKGTWGGGYVFARDPRHVTALDVVELLDGPVQADVCPWTTTAAGIDLDERLQLHCGDAAEVVRRRLRRVNVADLAGPAEG
jgi:Rrf2 family protein